MAAGGDNSQILFSTYQFITGTGTPADIKGTATATGNWGAIQIMSPTATIASCKKDGSPTLFTLWNDIPYAQGITIYGFFTEITLTNATDVVRAYGINMNPA